MCMSVGCTFTTVTIFTIIVSCFYAILLVQVYATSTIYFTAVYNQNIILSRQSSIKPCIIYLTLHVPFIGIIIVNPKAVAVINLPKSSAEHLIICCRNIAVIHSIRICQIIITIRLLIVDCQLFMWPK